MKIHALGWVLSAGLALAMQAPPAAHAAVQDTRQELKPRFEARYHDINVLKERGIVGETWEGFVEPVIGRDALDKKHQRLLDDENADRRRLYNVIASEVTPGRKQLSPAEVGRVNAERKFRKARPEDHLKLREGRWIQKRDEARARALADLKRDGVVGETFEGYLEAVKPQDRADPTAANLIEQENRARRELYARMAKAREESAEAVARAAARQIEQGLPPGHWFKQRSGEWRKQPDDRAAA